MRVSASGVVCGYPALSIRDLLRRAAGTFSAAFAQEAMGIDEPTATALLTDLETEGYVEKVDEHGEIAWRASVQGSALAMASAAPPMKREVADGMLVDFLRRVEQVRDDARWSFKVDTLVLFGSYLSDSPTLGDIDLAIALRPAHKDGEAQDRAAEERRREAERIGRRFPDHARLSWPEDEVTTFLRGRQRFTLHDPRDDAPAIEAGPQVTLYAGERVCEGSIALLHDWNAGPARQARELAAIRQESQTIKRQLATAKKKSEELADARAKMDRFLAMTPEEREQHRSEITALLAKYG